MGKAQLCRPAQQQSILPGLANFPDRSDVHRVVDGEIVYVSGEWTQIETDESTANLQFGICCLLYARTARSISLALSDPSANCAQTRSRTKRPYPTVSTSVA
jgi:hypothetical protein